MSICWMKEGKNCFLWVCVEAFAHFYQLHYLTPSHKRQGRQGGAASPLEKGQRLPRSSDGDGRPVKATATAAFMLGRLFLLTLKCQYQDQGRWHAENSRSSCAQCCLLAPDPKGPLPHLPSFLLLFLPLSPFLSLPLSVKGLP